MNGDHLKTVWIILDNFRLRVFKAWTAVALLLCLAPHSSAAAACAPFEIYRGMNRRIPPANIYHPHPDNLNSVNELLTLIGRVPGHSHFTELYSEKRHDLKEEQEAEYLDCIYHYIRQDIDKDGLPDWQAASAHQLFDWPVPRDQDWDNDGIANVFDPEPFARAAEPQESWRHLRLSSDTDSPLNSLQTEIYRTCGVLPLNHTDTHDSRVLTSFARICKSFLRRFKAKSLTFTLYAFAGHSLFKDIKASYYPELNYISIGGSLSVKDKISDERILLTLGHEIGHYLIFNRLKPDELVQVATLKSWNRPAAVNLSSFFDPLLLSRKATASSGYFPSSYSATNMHEWFSEVFSFYLANRLNGDKKAYAIPAPIENWLKRKNF